MEKDGITQQIEKLIEAGLFRDLRCPNCNSHMITTNLEGQHRCLDCETKFDSLEKEN